MTDSRSLAVKVVVAAALVIGMVGCGTAAKEKTAPCKRPANLTSYGPDPRRDCPSMTSVNGNPSEALAAIRALTAQ
ncbi:hypothetical protein [Rhizobium sp.]|uniref:hypothetical protein n=1 Tax=Rhizobium sp. TaxID=391 RepID=UPI00289FFEA1